MGNTTSHRGADGTTAQEAPEEVQSMERHEFEAAEESSPSLTDKKAETLGYAISIAKLANEACERFARMVGADTVEDNELGVATEDGRKASIRAVNACALSKRALDDLYEIADLCGVRCRLAASRGLEDDAKEEPSLREDPYLVLMEAAQELALVSLALDDANETMGYRFADADVTPPGIKAQHVYYGAADAVRRVHFECARAARCA